MYCSFEVSREAKYKGFKPKTPFFGYISKFYRHSTRTLISYGRTGRSSINNLIYAPSKYELQTWLRSQDFNIIVHSGIGDKIWWSYQILRISNNTLLLNKEISWLIFEEALEFALLDTLNLIS